MYLQCQRDGPAKIKAFYGEKYIKTMKYSAIFSALVYFGNLKARIARSRATTHSGPPAQRGRGWPSVYEDNTENTRSIVPRQNTGLRQRLLGLQERNGSVTASCRWGLSREKARSKIFRQFHVRTGGLKLVLI